MRKIDTSDKINFYIQVPPSFIGEGLCFMGIALPIVFFPTLEGFAGLILLFLGIVIVRYKYRKTKRSIDVLKNGAKSTAIITNISTTGIRHNNRVVKVYNFRFYAGDKAFNTEFKSAHKPNLQVGDQLTIFYMPDNPHDCCLPTLYNIYLF